MSVPTKEQATNFLAPLKGSVAILLLHDARAKFALARFLFSCVSVLSLGTTILDSDAFYSTNMEEFVDENRPAPKGEVLLLTERDFEVTSLLPLLSSRRELLVIDDLNSLYSLASDGRKSQQLTILLKFISYNARMNGSSVVATAYRTDLDQKRRGANQRSLTALGDLLIDTDLRAGSIRLKASLKDYWPNGEYTL